MLYQSLKSIHYRTLLIFQNKKKPNRFEGQNMGGGIKDMSSPPRQNMGGYITPIPPRIYALGIMHYTMYHVLPNCLF